MRYGQLTMLESLSDESWQGNYVLDCIHHRSSVITSAGMAACECEQMVCRVRLDVKTTDDEFRETARISYSLVVFLLQWVFLDTAPTMTRRAKLMLNLLLAMHILWNFCLRYWSRVQWQNTAAWFPRGWSQSGWSLNCSFRSRFFLQASLGIYFKGSADYWNYCTEVESRSIANMFVVVPVLLRFP